MKSEERRAGCMSFFFQAEDGIRYFCLSRGLGDVYKGQVVRGESFTPLG